MPELFKYIDDKRIVFRSGHQRRFLFQAVKKLRISWFKFAEKLGVNKRTLSDWKRERYSLPLSVLEKISRLAKLKTPSDIKIKKPFWWVEKSGQIAGKMEKSADVRP